MVSYRSGKAFPSSVPQVSFFGLNPLRIPWRKISIVCRPMGRLAVLDRGDGPIPTSALTTRRWGRGMVGLAAGPISRFRLWQPLAKRKRRARGVQGVFGEQLLQ